MDCFTATGNAIDFFSSSLLLTRSLVNIRVGGIGVCHKSLRTGLGFICHQVHYLSFNIGPMPASPEAPPVKSSAIIADIVACVISLAVDIGIGGYPEQLGQRRAPEAGGAIQKKGGMG